MCGPGGGGVSRKALTTIFAQRPAHGTQRAAQIPIPGLTKDWAVHT